MALPATHLESLEPYVHNHASELKRLRALHKQLTRELKQRLAGQWRDPNPKPYSIPGLESEIELVERMIAMHERLLVFANDDRGLGALAQLLESPDAAKLASRDPRAYAAEHGIELPSGLEVECIVRHGAVEVHLTHYDRLAPFTITWTSDGFMPPPAAARRRRPGKAAAPAPAASAK